MKPTLLLLTLLFSCVQLKGIAQANNFSIGAYFSNEIGYRLLKHNDNNPDNDFVLEDRNEREIPKYCYSAGLSVEYSLTNKFSIRAGILYSNKGYQTKKLSVSSGFSDDSFPSEVKLKYNMNYIDVPIVFNYRFGKKKMRFYVGAGLTTNIFLQENVTSIQYYGDEVEKETYEDNFDYNRINISPRIEFGVIYDFNEKMYLTAGPSFNYGLMKIIDAPITGYLYTGGIHLAFHFR